MSKATLFRRVYRALRRRSVQAIRAGRRYASTPRGRKATAILIGAGGAIGATAVTALLEELIVDPVSRAELNEVLRQRGVTDDARFGDMDELTASVVERFLGGSIRDAIEDRDELISATADALIETADVLDVDVATSLRFIANLALISVVDDDVIDAAIKQRISRGYGTQSQIQTAITRITSAKELAALPSYLEEDDTPAPSPGEVGP